MLSNKLKNKILEITNSNSIESIELLQKLWSDYGNLIRVNLDGGNAKSIIIKQINLEEKKKNTDD